MTEDLFHAGTRHSQRSDTAAVRSAIYRRARVQMQSWGGAATSGFSECWMLRIFRKIQQCV